MVHTRDTSARGSSSDRIREASTEAKPLEIRDRITDVRMACVVQLIATNSSRGDTNRMGTTTTHETTKMRRHRSLRTSGQSHERRGAARPIDLGSRLTHGIQWRRFALNLTEILAPNALAKAIGWNDDKDKRAPRSATEAFEIWFDTWARRQAPWLWARVGNDILDLALIRWAQFSNRKLRKNGGVALTKALVRESMVRDAIAATWVTGAAFRSRRGLGGLEREQRATAVITIACRREVAYAQFRDFEKLPTIMSHLLSVETIDERRSRWRVKGPAGSTISWEAEIIEDCVNESIVWRSREGSDIQNTGSVRFVDAPAGRGTEVHVSMRYCVPGGKLGVAVAKLLMGEDPTQQLRGDLRRLKQVLETGDVVLAKSGGMPS